MSEVNNTPDSEFEAANSDLNRGLKICRSVVKNYRALLSSNDNAVIGQGQGQDEASNTTSVES